MLKFYKINKKIYLISLIGAIITFILTMSYPQIKIFITLFAIFMLIFLTSIILNKILNKRIEQELHAKQLEEIKNNKGK